MSDQFWRRVADESVSRVSRRSLLGKAVKLALALVGTQLLPALPVFKPEIAEAAVYTDCTDPALCGIQGRPCEWCNSNGSSSCPAGTVSKFQWTYCCCFPWGGGLACYNMSYRDCCVQGTSNPTCPSAPACLDNHPTSGNWCYNDGGYNSPETPFAYVCTVVTQGTSCGS